MIFHRSLFFLPFLFFALLSACSMAKPPISEPRDFPPQELSVNGLRCSLTTSWEDDQLHYIFVIDRSAAVATDELLLRPVVTVRLTGQNDLSLISINLTELNPLKKPVKDGERIEQSGTIVCPLETYRAIRDWKIEVEAEK